ncbi:MAG: hypothetical protein QMC62_14345 [Alteromonadaceae bacterium]
MTITDEIIIIANQLANQGKKPTVALVKTRLIKSAPLPTIISILRNWTHDPNFVQMTIESNDVETKKKHLTSITSEIEKAIRQALQPIEAELLDLRALVNELSKQQDKD